MAISDRGIDGSPGMGLWGPVIFTIPLLAAWYSYEQLTVIRATYDQTIRALGAAPELGGLVRAGHSERVAGLATGPRTNSVFPVTRSKRSTTAVFLHHLGQVCLDEPERGHVSDPAAVARAGADILRRTPLLAPAGDIIATEPDRTRRSQIRRPWPDRS